MRQKQFHVLIYSVQLLQQILEDDEEVPTDNTTNTTNTTTTTTNAATPVAPVASVTTDVIMEEVKSTDSKKVDKEKDKVVEVMDLTWW